jgi:hypothetical protein
LSNIISPIASICCWVSFSENRGYKTSEGLKWARCGASNSDVVSSYFFLIWREKMTKNTVKIMLSAIALGLMTSGAIAADEPIYGSQMMTNQERMEQRTKMNAAKTAQVREQVRLEHHEQMQLRAKERGVTLLDTPPAQGAGMRQGMGPGGGMGGGMGGGRGR